VYELVVDTYHSIACRYVHGMDDVRKIQLHVSACNKAIIRQHMGTKIINLTNFCMQPANGFVTKQVRDCLSSTLLCLTVVYWSFGVVVYTTG
jgi:hypothetical protein